MESHAGLEASGAGGRYRLSGVLNFETVPGLLSDSEHLFKGETDVEVDMAPVTGGNSAGLGLLLEWMRRAHLANRRIRFRNIPAGMWAVAQASDLDGLIPVAD